MTADFDALLDEAIRATGVERYRWLCSDANTLPPPNSRDDWRRFILARRWEAPAVAPTEGRYVPAGSIDLPADYRDRLPPLGGCCG